MQFKLFIIMLLCVSGLSAAAPDTQWTRTIGDAEWEQSYGIDICPDSGFIIGATNRWGTSDAQQNAYIIRTDKNGDTLWTKEYGTSYGDVVTKIIRDTDGGFVMVGAWHYKAPGKTDGFFLKTDSAGDSLWLHEEGGSGDEILHSLCPAGDGGYFIGGFTDSEGAGEDDAWLIRTDSLGQTVWDSTYGGSMNEIIMDIQPDGAGGFYLCGNTRTYGAGSMDYWISRIDADGNRLWSNAFGGASYDEAREMVTLPGGGCAVIGQCQSFGAGQSNAWLLRLDENGDTLWSKILGSSGSDRGLNIDLAADGGFVIGGVSDSYGNGSDDMWVVRTDSLGDTLWSKTVGGSGGDGCYGLKITPDGGIIMAGWTDSYGSGQDDIWLVKLAPEEEPVQDTDSLAGYWAFDEGDGDTAFDQSIYSNHGVLQGVVVWESEGISGTCLRYDSLSEVVDCGMDASLGFNREQTVLLWVKPDLDCPVWAHLIMCKQDTFNAYDIHIEGTEDRVDVVSIKDSVVKSIYAGVGAVRYGAWNHIAVVFSGADSIAVYINGIHHNNHTGGGWNTGSGGFEIGSTQNDSKRMYKGLIDEVKVYTAVLDAGQIQNVYLTQAPASALDSLVAYWSFDEGTGTTLYDSTTHNYDGTITGAAWSAGVSGGCLSFDGSDDMVGVPHDTDLHNGFVSISAWAISDLSASPVNAKRIITKGFDVGSIDLMQDGRIRAVRWIGGYWRSVYIPAGAWNTGEWFHVVQTYENDYLKIYLNGVIQDSLYVTGAFGSGTDPVEIGGFSVMPTYDYWWDGKIDEVKIFSTGLSADDVQALYDEHAPVQTADSLVAYWSFDEGSGDTLFDSTVHGFNGVITSATWSDGISGGCLEFDGIHDVVSVPHDSVLHAGLVTISAWAVANSDTAGVNANHLINKNFDVGGIGLIDDGRISATRWIGNAWRSVYVAAGAWLPGEWFHVVQTYENGYLKVYLNGAIQDSMAASGDFGGGNDPLEIGGCLVQTGERWWDGKIDEVKIFSTGLSAADVQALYDEYAPESVDDTLIAHWDFNDGSGTILTDIGPCANHGTVAGASWTAGVDSGALLFTADDYVNVGKLGDLGSLSNTCTVMGWVNWSHSSSWQAVFGGYDGDMQLGFHINREGSGLTSSAGDVVCYLRSEDAKAVGGGTVGKSYNDGEWHHFAWVYRDASANQLELFVDGQPVTVSMFIETSPQVLENFSHDLLLGARSYTGTPEKFYTGSLDEFRVYSVALSETEIRTIYNLHAPATDSLVAYWPLNEGAGDSVMDVLGGFHGTFVGSPMRDSGIAGGGVDFDKNGYIDCGTGLGDYLGERNKVSVSLWINYHTLDPNTGFFYIGGFGGAGHDDEAFSMNFYQNQWEYRFNNHTWQKRLSVPAPQTDTWFHIVVTYDGDTVRSYFDGEPAAADAFSEPVDFRGYKTTIGTYYGIPTGSTLWNQWITDGRMDEVKVFGTALSAADVQALYDESVPPDPPVFSSFSVELSDGNPVLIWETIDEAENMGFNILRAGFPDATFQVINERLIPAPPSLPSYYTYVDETAGSGTWYYVIEQLDMAGEKHYSDTVVVRITGLEDAPVMLRQNPVADNPLAFSLQTGRTVGISVFDVNGTEALSVKPRYYEAGIHTVLWRGILRPGLHFIRIRGEDFHQVKRVMIVR